MAATRLSSKGQVVIPKEVRDRHAWRPGVTLEVEDRGDCVVLRLPRTLRRTTVADLEGCVDYTGPRVSQEQMDSAVAEAARNAR